MASIIGAIATSHTPTIGFAKDRRLENDPIWKPIFDAYEHMRAIEEAAKAKTRAVRRAGQRRRDHAALEKLASAQPTIGQNPTASTTAIEPFDELDDLSS